MSHTSDFIPAWWLRNPHLQTVWPTFMRRTIPMTLSPQRLELPDGDFIDLVWDATNRNDRHKPIVVILHGLAGSLKSPYARGLMRAISTSGWRPVLMHFRGASGVPNRLIRSYHSGDTADVAYVVESLLQTNPGVDMAAVGFSLGGNVLLKWLGQTASHNPLTAAVAVSVPFELLPVTNTLNTGLSKIYQWVLLRQLRQEIKFKFNNTSLDCPFDLEQVTLAKNFYAFDELVTAPLHDFKGAAEYYQQASSRQYLPPITTPTLIIHAEDDPFMPPCVIPTREELSACTRLEVSAHGGHVGFIGGDTPGKAEYWLEKRIPQFFAKLLK
jgi:predicted alpha/beta-fold hydrolase